MCKKNIFFLIIRVLKKSINNSKENTIKMLYNNKTTSNRISNYKFNTELDNF